MFIDYAKLDVENSLLTDSEMPKQLKVWIVQTHSDIPINMRLYRRDEMKQQVRTFTEPYGKPVLLHHDQQKDPIGRVVEAYYIPAEKFEAETKRLTGKPIPIPDGQTGGILLKAYITDEVGIKKILSGLYKTVSVGFTADELRCSICGKKKDMLSMLSLFGGVEPDSDEYCTEHEIGKEYDGEVQYIVPLGISYQEVSFVNSPADAYAGIAKISAASLEEAMQNIGVELEDETAEVVLTDAVNSQTQQDIKQDSGEEENMKEIEALKAEVDKLKQENEQLKALVDEYKERLVGELAALKQIIANLSDEEVETQMEQYRGYDIETIKVLLSDYAKLADRLIDEEMKQELEEVVEEAQEDNDKAAEAEEKDQPAEEKEQPQAEDEQKAEIVRDTQQEAQLSDEVIDPFELIDHIITGKKS